MELRHILLTGGIGSGKSTVAERLAAEGLRVIDADAVGHAVLEGEARASVRDAWPEAVDGNVVDRRKLGRLVFGDREQLRRLEALTHPHIQARIHDELTRACGIVVVETHLPDWMSDRLWFKVVVHASIETRVKRLVERGLTESEAAARIEAQPSADQYLADADFVIENNSDLESLEDEIGKLAQFIRSCDGQQRRPRCSRG